MAADRGKGGDGWVRGVSAGGVLRRLPLEHETSVFLLLNVVDLLLTLGMVCSGHFAEANPLARRVITAWGLRGLIVYKMGAVAGICLLAQVLERNSGGLGRRILNLGSVAMGLVIGYSLWLLMQRFG
ncbi:MAG: hypothetical protein JXR77_11080, partial [Lentisphaeria bacterium]|nr:hypothetical protein [Lentisphaeria bacterium]